MSNLCLGCMNFGESTSEDDSLAILKAAFDAGVIPASHKSNFAHPDTERARMKPGEVTSVDDVEGAIAHGSAKRVNPGERRSVVYRYGPKQGRLSAADAAP